MKRQISLDGIRLCIEYNSHNYKIDFSNRKLVYRNISGQGRGEYPEDFFNEYVSEIDKRDMQIMNHILKSINIKNWMILLK